IQLGASGGSYSWTVTGAASETARFRALSATNPAIGDTTDGAVRLGVPQLTFTAPAAAETLIVGQTVALSWTRRFAAGDVRVELSRAGAEGPWEEIGIRDGDSLHWPVIGPTSNSVRLRLSLTDAPLVSQTTPFDCAILQPELDIVAPAAGSMLPIGRTTHITWTRTVLGAPVNVWLLRVPEGNEELLAGNLAGNSYDWMATGPASDNARIIVRTADGADIEAQSGEFRLSQPVISFAAPLGGETFVAGEILPVRWHRYAVGDPVNVEINRDYPSATWSAIASAVSDTVFEWTVSGPTTHAARLRLVSTVEPTLGDTLGEAIHLLVPSLEWDWGERAEVLIGFPTELHWRRTAVDGAVTIRLSRDGGSTWPETVAANLTDNFFEWTPSGASAPAARLRVESMANPAVFAVTELFALTVPQISLVNPLGGETLAIGAPLVIRWSRVNHPAAVHVLVSREELPQTWEAIAQDIDSDSLIWIATPPASNTMRVRIVSTVNEEWFAESGEFSLQQAALAISAPLPETDIVMGDTMTAYWNRIAYDDAVRVLLRRGGGHSDTLSTGTAGDEIEFVVRPPAAAECWIVVEEAASGAPRDSVHLLGPHAPSIQILSPVTGDRWIADQSVVLRWQRDHADGDAVISINESYPSGSWQLLGTTELDSLNHVPFTPAGNLAVAVAIPSRGVADTVSGVRVVQPELEMEPLEQTAFRLGDIMSVRWHNHDITGLVRLELDRAFPSGAWETLYEGADTIFAWTVSGDTTSAARLRVRSLVYASAADTLTEDVRIYQAQLALDLDSDADTLYVGQALQFLLTMTDETEAADIAVQRELGGAWELLFPGVTSGSYAWTVTSPEAAGARFRAFVPGDPRLDDTTHTVAILHPSIALEGDLAADYTVGDTIFVAWDAWGVDAPFRLLLVRDEASAETLATDIAETAFEWIVTAPRASQARLIVQDATGTIADGSAPFAIHAPELAFVNPSESGTETAGSTLTLAWQWTDGAGAVQLDVSRDGVGGEWSTLDDSLAATTYDYLVTGPETDSLRFRVRALDDTTIAAMSPARTVIVPGLALQTPGGDTWYIGEQRWIRWNRAHYEGPVIVETTAADRAEPWEMLANEVMSDSFLWTVTGPEADLVALRVTAELDPTLTDTTDSPLTIALPRLRVVSPNGGDTLHVGEEIRLLWNSEGVQGHLGIGLWRGAPENRFDTLFTDTENDGEEFWTISAPAAEQCFLILVSLADTSVWDTSDPRFVIQEPSSVEDLWPGLPAEYSLKAPYPNPFNNAANLEFALPHAADVRIVVYDVMGREAATLVNDVRAAGRHRVSWQADGAASGMYFARMTSGDFTAVRKLQLVK
ncbi:MAG: T9SS type A sorting domain-containing protein, partial [bacterium]|nr:T9SS type A sorting domain-containing protein [bacterium]